MTTQDIFKAFGSNWTWASISLTGKARIYTGEPVPLASGLIQSPFGERVSRCEAFDTCAPLDALIWKRTDFSNGPRYETDQFGIPLPVAPPQVPQLPPTDTWAAPPMAPPPGYPSAPEVVSVRDHGGVTQYGAHTFVWYDEAEQVAGAASTLDEAVRQQQAYSDSLNVSAVPEVVEAISAAFVALQLAKAHARHLTLCCEADNNTQSLTTTQYMAIFGELPQ